MSATTLLPAAEFLKRADQRTVAKLCSDTDEAVEAGALAADPNLAAALLAASGDVEAALVSTGRYTAAQLQALTGTALAALYDLIAPFAVVKLYDRRPDRKPPDFGPGLVKAQWDLERYRWGDRVLA